MKNLILKAKDLVQITKPHKLIKETGLQIGHVYPVEGELVGKGTDEETEILYLRGPNGLAMLTYPDESLTDACDCIKLVKAPVALSRGL